MNFAVIWLPAALNQLADLWTAAPDRAAVTAASYRLDERLAADPLTEGESRDGGDRIAFERPLRVIFRVSEATREVHVVSVGRATRRRS